MNDYIRFLEYIIIHFHKYKFSEIKETISYLTSKIISITSSSIKKKNKSLNFLIDKSSTKDFRNYINSHKNHSKYKDFLVYSIRKMILNLLDIIKKKDVTICELLAENAKLTSQKSIIQIIPNQNNAISVTLSM
jgi:hypothetical protein